MDLAVRQHLALETRVLVHEERAGEAVRRVVCPRLKEVTAVGGHRQVRVVGALPYEPEEREDAGPGAGRGVEPADLLQHEGDEGRDGPAVAA